MNKKTVEKIKELETLEGEIIELYKLLEQNKLREVYTLRNKVEKHKRLKKELLSFH